MVPVSFVCARKLLVFIPSPEVLTLPRGQLQEYSWQYHLQNTEVHGMHDVVHAPPYAESVMPTLVHGADYDSARFGSEPVLTLAGRSTFLSPCPTLPLAHHPKRQKQKYNRNSSPLGR